MVNWSVSGSEVRDTKYRHITTDETGAFSPANLPTTLKPQVKTFTRTQLIAKMRNIKLRVNVGRL